jgi:Replication initiation factor
MDTVFFVDWITGVVDWTWMNVQAGFAATDYNAELCGVMLTGLRGWKACKPRNHYMQGWRNTASGALLLYHPGRPDMGVAVVYSGSVLAQLSWRLALKMLAEKEARFTRLDMTMDTYQKGFNIRELHHQAEMGECITRCKTFPLWVEGEGVSMRAGALGSEKSLLIYDKGAEQGTGADERIRIEFQAHKGAARWLASIMAADDLGLCLDILCGHFDAPNHPGWCLALGSARGAERIPSEKKLPNTEAWLMSQVARTMARAERRRPGILDEFFDSVIDLL